MNAPLTDDRPIVLEQRRRRARWLMPVAAAGIVGIALAGITAVRSSTPASALSRAIGKTAQLERGRVEVSIDAGNSASSPATISYRFDGADRGLSIASPSMNVEARRVGGAQFVRVGSAAWQPTDGATQDMPMVKEELDKGLAALGNLHTCAKQPATGTAYCGTLTDAKAIDNFLVFKLSDTTAQPTKADIAVVVNDGLVGEVTVDTTVTTDNGPVHSTVTSRLVDVGSAQGITRPA
jgi:hypothetical protein